MMHARLHLINGDETVVASCIDYLEVTVRPVLEKQRGSLGTSLLTSPDRHVAIFGSFWASDDALWTGRRAEAPLRPELTRRANGPVAADDYQIPVFERDAPLRAGDVVRLTRMAAKMPGFNDVIEVYGDTAVPSMAEVPGFRGALMFADPDSGQLISETVWADPRSLQASPSVASVIRTEVLAETGCEIRAVEDYVLRFSSVRKP